MGHVILDNQDYHTSRTPALWLHSKVVAFKRIPVIFSVSYIFAVELAL